MISARTSIKSYTRVAVQTKDPASLTWIDRVAWRNVSVQQLQHTRRRAPGRWIVQGPSDGGVHSFCRDQKGCVMSQRSKRTSFLGVAVVFAALAFATGRMTAADGAAHAPN